MRVYYLLSLYTVLAIVCVCFASAPLAAEVKSSMALVLPDNGNIFTGIVTEIEGDSIRVRVGNSLLIVAGLGRAEIIVAGSVNPTIADLLVGDRVEVYCVPIRCEEYEARSLRVVGPRMCGRSRKVMGPIAVSQGYFSGIGVITSSNPATRKLAIRTMGGNDYDVDASKASVFSKSGALDFEALAIGDNARVRGLLDDKRIDAEVVHRVNVGYIGQKTSIMGEVSSYDEKSGVMVVKWNGKLLSVHIPEMSVVIMTDGGGDLSEIREELPIKVKGRWMGGEAIEASYVEMFPTRGK